MFNGATSFGLSFRRLEEPIVKAVVAESLLVIARSLSRLSDLSDLSVLQQPDN